MGLPQHRYLIHAAADEAYLAILSTTIPPCSLRHSGTDARSESRVVCVEDAGSGRSTVPVGRAPRPVMSAPTARECPGCTAWLPRSFGYDPGDRRNWKPICSSRRVDWSQDAAAPGPMVAKPVDDAWVGVDVAFVQSDAASLTQRRSQRVWSAAKGPGAWLTHGKAQAPIEIADDDGSIDLVYDDVAWPEEGVEVESGID